MSESAEGRAKHVLDEFGKQSGNPAPEAFLLHVLVRREIFAAEAAAREERDNEWRKGLGMNKEHRASVQAATRAAYWSAAEWCHERRHDCDSKAAEQFQAGSLDAAAFYRSLGLTHEASAAHFKREAEKNG